MFAFQRSNAALRHPASDHRCPPGRRLGSTIGRGHGPLPDSRETATSRAAIQTRRCCRLLGGLPRPAHARLDGSQRSLPSVHLQAILHRHPTTGLASAENTPRRHPAGAQQELGLQNLPGFGHGSRKEAIENHPDTKQSPPPMCLRPVSGVGLGLFVMRLPCRGLPAPALPLFFALRSATVCQ